MDKIPVYVSSNYIINEEFETIQTESVYMDNINDTDKIYFNEILYSPTGTYISINDIFEKLGGTFDEKNSLNSVIFNHSGIYYKINVKTMKNKNKVIERNNDFEIYSVHPSNTSDIALLAKKNPLEYSDADAKLIQNSQIKIFDGKLYLKIDVYPNIMRYYVVLRPLIEGSNNAGKTLKLIKVYSLANDMGSAAIVQGGNGSKAMFYAVNYKYKGDSIKIDAVELAALKLAAEKQIFVRYCVSKLEDGSMIVYRDFLRFAFKINENDIYHLPGDIFGSEDTAIRMYKAYYDKDESYENNKNKYYVGTAIYKNGNGYSYCKALDYNQILNRDCISGNYDQKFKAYIFPDKFNSKITVEQLKKEYKYTHILLYYKNGNGNYDVIDERPNDDHYKKIEEKFYKINEINHSFDLAVNKFKEVYLKNKAVYSDIANKAGVPPEVIAAIHYRENTPDFLNSTFGVYLHNGQPLGKETTMYPKDILFYNFTDAALAALESQQRYIEIYKLSVNSKNIISMLAFAEKYNGTGYSDHEHVSPYLFSGTDIYISGKYKSDNNYDPNIVDDQVGVYRLLLSVLH